MTTRVLGSLQVAALLVSASYGIGFLFGSGEMALTHRHGGRLYGVATALGMLAGELRRQVVEARHAGLGVVRTRLRSAHPARVALLSLVWMSGVLGGPDRRAALPSRK
jgi:SSS family solute:Na+ symporter